MPRTTISILINPLAPIASCPGKLRQGAPGTGRDRRLRQQWDAAAFEANHQPSRRQAMRELQMGHLNYQGLDISTENRRAARARQGLADPDATHYGYIKGTIGRWRPRRLLRGPDDTATGVGDRPAS